MSSKPTKRITFTARAVNAEGKVVEAPTQYAEHLAKLDVACMESAGWTDAHIHLGVSK